MAHTVKVVAELTGISIRMLHHYDKIGLLKPAQVSASGYRLYTEQDLDRLQQVLFFRELGFGLWAVDSVGQPNNYGSRKGNSNERARDVRRVRSGQV